MSSEKQITVNFYDVLNISEDCSRQDIKEAYKKLVSIYHPDRPKGDAEMFELITHAYNVLYDPISRKQWDELYKLTINTNNHDHYKLRQRHHDYVQHEVKNVEELNKNPYDSVDFKKSMEDMDRKHNFRRDDMKKILTKKDTDQLLRDYEDARELNNIEDMQEKLFTDDKLDTDKFNAVFETMYKHQDSLIPHTGNPLPWDMSNMASFSNTSYSTIDNFDNICSDHDDNFGAVFDAHVPQRYFTKKDADKVVPKNNVKLTPEENLKSLEDLIRERDQVTQKLKDRKLTDFETYDNDPSCGGYGFLHQIGYQKMYENQKDDEENMHKYKRLLEMRKDH